MLNSVPANVFPVRSWMIPAISWTSPPDMSAMAKITGVTPALTQPMLITLSMIVGTANAASASGPEFPHPKAVAGAAGGETSAGGDCGAAGLRSGCLPPLRMVDICSS